MEAANSSAVSGMNTRHVDVSPFIYRELHTASDM